MKAFEYHQPGSLEEASKLLTELDGSMVYAGGTDIIPRTKFKKLTPDHLVNIKKIQGLNGIEFDGETLTLGALVRFNDIVFSDVLKEHFPIIVSVARSVASHQVRNLATVGGNLCNAAPSADSAPMLIALGARVRMFGPAGEREMPLEKFFKGPSESHLEKGEILTHIILAKPREGNVFSYQKHKIRRSLEIAIVGVAVAIEIEDGICKDAKVVVGAAAPTPIRCTEAEYRLIGGALDDAVIEAAGESAAAEVSPIDDVRGSADYRREMTAVCLQRAVKEAMGAVE